MTDRHTFPGFKFPIDPERGFAMWEVTGGSDKGGILVREGQALSSKAGAEEFCSTNLVEHGRFKFLSRHFLVQVISMSVYIHTYTYIYICICIYVPRIFPGPPN